MGYILRRCSTCEASREEWRQIPNHPGYEVSDHGRVRSVDRTVICGGGQVARHERTYRGQEIIPGVGANGRLLVMLGRGCPRLVHRLVLEAFVGPRPAGRECLHYDDVKSHNHLGNLRWGTRSENLYDMYRNKGKYDG